MKKLMLWVSIVGVLCGLLWGKSFWEEKPYTEWNKKEVARILLDSPWADAESFDKRGGRGTQRRYYIRFHSAAPIRMAMARNAVLEGRADEGTAQQFVDVHPSPGYVVVGLSVATGQPRAELTRLTTEILKQRAYLQLKGSGKRIYLERYENPNEIGGGEAYLYFPRTQNGAEQISLDEKEVRFNCELDPDTWINMPFSLKKMIFNGKLEI